MKNHSRITRTHRALAGVATAAMLVTMPAAFATNAYASNVTDGVSDGSTVPVTPESWLPMLPADGTLDDSVVPATPTGDFDGGSGDSTVPVTPTGDSDGASGEICFTTYSIPNSPSVVCYDDPAPVTPVPWKPATDAEVLPTPPADFIIPATPTGDSDGASGDSCGWMVLLDGAWTCSTDIPESCNPIAIDGVWTCSTDIPESCHLVTIDGFTFVGHWVCTPDVPTTPSDDSDGAQWVDEEPITFTCVADHKVKKGFFKMRRHFECSESAVAGFLREKFSLTSEDWKWNGKFTTERSLFKGRGVKVTVEGVQVHRLVEA